MLFSSNCRSRGLPNNIETYGLVSGLWTSTFALGAFFGPSVSGLLYDSIGFRKATIFIIALHAIVGAIVLLTLCIERTPSPYKELHPSESIIKSHDTFLYNNKTWVNLPHIFLHATDEKKYWRTFSNLFFFCSGSSLSIDQPHHSIANLINCNSLNHKQCQAWSQ